VVVAQALVAATALGVALCAYLLLVSTLLRPALEASTPLWERTALLGLLAAVGAGSALALAARFAA
jgi:hypothetical protein